MVYILRILIHLLPFELVVVDVILPLLPPFNGPCLLLCKDLSITRQLLPTRGFPIIFQNTLLKCCDISMELSFTCCGCEDVL